MSQAARAAARSGRGATMQRCPRGAAQPGPLRLSRSRLPCGTHRARPRPPALLALAATAGAAAAAATARAAAFGGARLSGGGPGPRAGACAFGRWPRLPAPGGSLAGGPWCGRRGAAAAAGGGASEASASEEDVIAQVQAMRVREIKKELEDAGVRTSDCFEKAEMAERLVAFRRGGAEAVPMAAAPEEARPGPSAPAAAAAAAAAEPAPEQQPASEAAGGASETPTEEIMERCRAMRVKELRTELGTRGMSWADCLEKEELVQRLAAVLAREAAFCRTGRVHPGRVAELTGAELDEELGYPSTPVLLDVFATWCGPCKMMAPQLEAAARTLGNTVRVVKMDSDKEPEMSSRLRVGGLPTVILFNREGKEVARQEGAVMEQQLLDMVRAASG